MQQEPEREPQPLGWGQECRSDQSDAEKAAGYDERPPTRGPAADERKQSDHGEDPGKHEPEAPVGAGPDGLFVPKVLVSPDRSFRHLVHVRHVL
jgi:hypothetical protein